MATDTNGVVLGPLPPGIPHLAIPFSIGSDGTAETLAQGTVPEIVQSVANLVGTRPGTRLMVPSYGIPDPTFAGVDPVALQLATSKWEPRATISTSIAPGNTEGVVIQVGIAQGASS